MRKNNLKIVKIDKNKSLFNYEKKILINDLINYYEVLKACIISFIYFIGGIVIFYYSYAGAKERGTLINMGE